MRPTLPASLTLAALALPLVLAAAPPALGQSRGTKIEEVLDGNRHPVDVLPPGAVVLLKGRGFWQPPPPPDGTDAKKLREYDMTRMSGIEVRVDGRAVMVLDSSAELVSFMLPADIAPGTKSIKVTVKDKGSDSSAVRVVSREQWVREGRDKREKERGELGRPGEVERDKAEKQMLETFKIERFLKQSTPTGDVFLVEGVAKDLPNGMRVRLKLGYGNRVIRERSVDVEGGKFRTTFGPYTQRLLVGNYSLELFFSLASQSQGAVREWLRKLPRDQVPLYKRVQRRGFASVGGTGQNGDIEKKDLEAQEKELQAHCKELAAKAEALMRKAQYGYAVAARCFYRGSGAHSYDKEAYKKYLLENKFAADAAEVEKIVKDTTLAGERGHFQSDAYTKWATGFLAELSALYKKHEDFNNRYVCPMDERAERLGHYLLSNVLKLFHRWSGSLYNHAKQDMPKEIAQVPFVVISAPTVSVQYFEAKKAELLKAVGL